jgi:hypothetical protein
MLASWRAQYNNHTGNGAMKRLLHVFVVWSMWRNLHKCPSRTVFLLKCPSRKRGPFFVWWGIYANGHTQVGQLCKWHLYSTKEYEASLRKGFRYRYSYRYRYGMSPLAKTFFKIKYESGLVRMIFKRCRRRRVFCCLFLRSFLAGLAQSGQRVDLCRGNINSVPHVAQGLVLR